MFTSATKENNLSNLKDTDNEMFEDLHNSADKAGRKVRSIFNAANAEISHAGKYAGIEIRANPVRSSVIALGVGVLLGALLRR